MLFSILSMAVLCFFAECLCLRFVFSFLFVFQFGFASLLGLAVRRKGNVFLLNVFAFGLFSVCMCYLFRVILELFFRVFLTLVLCFLTFMLCMAVILQFFFG